MADDTTHDIESILREGRKFQPIADFSRHAWVKSEAEHRELCHLAEQDPEKFWAERANQLDWFKPYEQVLDWQPPFAKWFVGGQLNACYNCVDRHLKGP